MFGKFYYKIENQFIEDLAEVKLPNFTNILLPPIEIFSSRNKCFKGRESIPFSSPETFSNSSSLMDLFTPLSLTPLSPRSISLGASYESGADTTEESEKYSFFGINCEGIGLCNITANSPHVEQFAIPLPKTHLKQFELITDARITACCLLGESQIWLGTDTGSLHILSLLPEDMIVLSHRTVQLVGPITAICTKPVKPSVNKGDESLVRFVYVALESGCLLEFSGAAGPTGGINPLERANKYIYLVKPMSDIKIRCLAYQQQTDYIWVGLTTQMKIIKPSDTGYKDHKSLRIDTQLPHNSYVSSIIQSDAGVWTSFAHAPFVILWDSESLLRKTSISLCNISTELDYTEDSKITRIAVSQNFIFLGTKGGYLVVYRSEDSAENSWEYTASTHCGDGEITDIHIQPCEEMTTGLTHMNIHVCLFNLEKMLNSSLVTLRFSKLPQRPVSKRLSVPQMRARYQVSQSMSVDSIINCPRAPKLNLIAFNETNTQTFLPLNESS
ncbi:hypothetical protein LOD99_12233 [Oopsacas minuta]|uniref:Uncharacterized protein n=1 Tax=Oopsacas minuta TaxID=111878 RepID=A0AAV7JEQ0_9METZ|nr:hypothetical protein LOD99_12233 [Oopsacas minuta]